MKNVWKSFLIGALGVIGLCIASGVGMFGCTVNPLGAGEVTPDTPPVVPPVNNPTREVFTIDNAVVVPSDVEAIQYPDMFNDPVLTTARVADPYCAIVQNEVAYPVEYLGNNEFPQITGAPLPTHIKRMIGIKDVWIPEPNLNDCPYGVPYEKMRQALDNTLLRVKALGADEITYTNYIEFLNFESAQLQDPGQAATGAEDLRYIARQAEAAGLDMTLYLNLAPGKVKVSWDIPGEEWLTTLINNWEPFVLDQARIAEETGIDSMMINHFDYQPGIQGYEEVYQAEMLDLLAKTRQVYSGRILFMIEPVWGADLKKLDTLLRSVDGFIYTPITTPLKDWSDKTVSVPNLKQSYANNLNSIAGDFGKFNKPFLFRILIQSERDFLEKGWNEDMFCIARGEDRCYQKSLPVDFSLQAIAYEAMLETIAQIDTGNTVTIDSIDVNGYWFTDVILPFNSQPQFAQTVRNKPAEAIIFQWFKR